MDEKTKSPVELLTDYLAAMTMRVIEAEKERDEANARADEWHRYWQARMAENKTMEARIAELEAINAELKAAIDNYMTGGHADAE